VKKLLVLLLLSAGASAQTTQGINVIAYPGADVGVQFANAYAANGCNTYVIPASTTAYAFSHTMHVPRCVSLLGQGRGIQQGITTATPGTSFGTTLLWTGGAGAAIVSSDHIPAPNLSGFGGTYGPSGGTIGNFTLTESAIVSGAIGIYTGGDPSGSISPSTDWAQETRLENIAISYFDTAWKGGSNVFWVNWFAPYIAYNNVGLTSDSAAADAGEEVNIFGGVITANVTGAFYNSSFEYHLFGTSIDFNGLNSGYQITNAMVELENCHVESSEQMIYSGTQLQMHGGTIQFDNSGLSIPQLIKMTSNVVNTLNLRGVNVYSQSTVSNLVYWPTNQSDPFPHLSITDLFGNHNGDVKSIINAVPSTLYKDVKIDTCLGPLCLVVNNR